MPAKKKKPITVERGREVKISVSERIEISGFQLAEMLKAFVIERLAPEIKAAEEKHPHDFMSHVEEGDVSLDGVHLEFCDNDPPYCTAARELIPLTPRLKQIVQAALVIRDELASDPEIDYGY